MLKSSTRQFEPDITRSGGTPTKVRYTIRCSKPDCSNTATYETQKVVSDESVIGKWFQQKGWVLGRNSRSFDVCPSCLGIKIADENRLAGHFKVSHKGNPVLSATQLAEQVFSMSQKPKDDTARLLEKHFGKPQDEQVTAPAAAAPPKRERLGLPGLERRAAPTSQVSQAAMTTPGAPAAVTSKPAAPAADAQQLEKVMSSIATDIETMRAAMELMVEQIGKMVSLQNEQVSLQNQQNSLAKEELAAQKQQIEAVARLAPIMARSAEGMSVTMRDAISQIREVAAPIAGAHDDEVVTPPAAQADVPQIEASFTEASRDDADRSIPAGQDTEAALVRRSRGRPKTAKAAAEPAAASADEGKKPRKRAERVSEDERNRRFLTLATTFKHPTTFGAKDALEKVPEFGYQQNAYGNLKTSVKRGLAESIEGGQFRFTATAAADLRAALKNSTAPAAVLSKAAAKGAKAADAVKSEEAVAAKATAPKGAKRSAAPKAEAAESSAREETVAAEARAPKDSKRSKAAKAEAVPTPVAEAEPTEKKARKQTERISEEERHHRLLKLAVEFPHPMTFGAKDALETIPDFGYFQNAYGNLKTATKRGLIEALGGGLFQFTARALAELKLALANAAPTPARAGPVGETKSQVEPKAAKPKRSSEPAAVAAKAAVIAVKRPRGRPRKHPRPDEVAIVQAPAPAAEAAPKKAKASQVAAAQPELNLGMEPVVLKRPRGRPRKHPLPEVAAAAGQGAGVGAVAAKTAELLSRVNWSEKDWSRHVSVYSQPDRKSPKKFSTVIQLDRKFWDLSGFSPDDRLQIERNQDEVVITRAESGGVKPKKVGEKTVVIQATTLGNLNLKKVKAAADEEAMVLRGSQV